MGKAASKLSPEELHEVFKQTHCGYCFYVNKVDLKICFNNQLKILIYVKLFLRKQNEK